MGLLFSCGESASLSREDIEDLQKTSRKTISLKTKKRRVPERALAKPEDAVASVSVSCPDVLPESMMSRGLYVYFGPRPFKLTEISPASRTNRREGE
ncbi:MAG: hypothetical protein BMS9Abin05_2219 [Rhodothermia bacterium]|nr:MAG: hypothetical protein BMS9Abin05_2219 [Rhodothermia bacterium]